MKHEQVYKGIGKVAGLYDMSLRVSGYRHAVLRFVGALRDLAGDSLTDILDAGCGTGQYTEALLDAFAEATVTAFDREEGMVRELRMKLQKKGLLQRAHLFALDITGPLPGIDGPFDALVISGVLEHVPLVPTIRNLSRFLKEGSLLLHSPVRDTPYGRKVGVLYGFTPRTEEENIGAFLSQGFRLLKIVRLPALHPASFKEAHLFVKEGGA